MALASIVKRGNPLYSFLYLMNDGSLSNPVAFYSATPSSFGGNIYVMAPTATPGFNKIVSVDPVYHTSSNIDSSNATYGGYVDFGFTQTVSTYGAGFPYTSTNILVTGDCNISIKVYRFNSDCNAYNATYDLLNVDSNKPLLAGMRTLCIRQPDPHNAVMLMNSVTYTPYGILNAALTIGDQGPYNGGGDLRNQDPTTVLASSAFNDIGRIFTSSSNFYYVGRGTFSNIYYGGPTGSSFTAVTGTTASSNKNVVDATFDPAGNMWFTLYDTTTYSPSVYTLNKFVLSTPSNGTITYTRTLATVGYGGSPVVGHIPTKGIVIIDDKGNGYYGASDDIYQLNPYYTY